MNLWQLWLSVQDLYKIKPVNIWAWRNDGFQGDLDGDNKRNP